MRYYVFVKRNASPRGPMCLFQVDAGMMLYRGDCDVHLQTNENW